MSDELLELSTIGNLDYIQKRKHKYANFIMSNEKIKKLYLEDVKKIMPNIQIGGDLGVGIVLGSVALIGLAYAYYKLIYKKKKHGCEEEYPIIDEKEIPEPYDIAIKILPKSFVEEHGDPRDVMQSLYNKIDKISSPLSILDENTTGEKIVVQGAKILTSILADVATVGAGGDVIVSLLFVIKNVLDLIKKLLDGVNKLLNDNNCARFIYDILSIDFRGGPKNVKCWIKYILDQYGRDLQAYEYICSFFDFILEELANLIGNMLGVSIPDFAGLPGLVIPMLIDKFKQGSLKYIEKKLDKYYRKMSKKHKALIRNPKAFKQYLNKKIKHKSFKKTIYKFLGKEEGKKLIIELLRITGPISHVINKGFALIYVMLIVARDCYQ